MIGEYPHFRKASYLSATQWAWTCQTLLSSHPVQLADELRLGAGLHVECTVVGSFSYLSYFV